MSNYAATVVKIESIRRHTGADRLQIATIFGNSVVVGLDTKVGDVGLFFCLESQIGMTFAQANDLIRRKDATGKAAGGMFDSNRRVRAQTLRGEKSMGFFCPLSYLENTFATIGRKMPDVKVGDEFEELDGIQISRKYVIPVPQRATTTTKTGKKIKKEESRIIPELWAFHFDTAQLGKNTHNIKGDSLVSISWKTHGSSGNWSNQKVKRRLSWWEKALKKVGVKIQDTEYAFVSASRKVIKSVGDEKKNGDHFYKEDLWTHAGQQFKGSLRKGEHVYGELLGYTPSGSWIQKNYDYGAAPGTYKTQLYRITMTNDDGHVTELPWHQVVYRARELGVETCPEIFYGYVSDFVGCDKNDPEAGQKLFDKLATEYVYDQDCQFCANKVPAEGVCVRVENGDGIVTYKQKAFRFLKHESDQLDSGVADIESVESSETGTEAEAV